MAKRGGSKGVEPETIDMPAVGDADVEKLRKYHAEIGALLARIDPQGGPLDRVSFHVRRHLPLYALVAIFALIVVLIPTRNDRNSSESASDITDTSDTGGDTGGDDFVDDSAADPGDVAGDGDQAAGPDTSGGGTEEGPAAGPGQPDVAAGPSWFVQAGKTAGNFACKPGVRQIPWSAYANPCIKKFTGSNGGATYRGVTAKEIKITIRRVAVDTGDVTDAAARAQGAATRAEGVALAKKYAGYFNKVFDLYGRKVVFDDFTSDVSNGIEEAQSRGKEGACADATEIAETRKSFASVGYTGALTESEPFAHCAKERKIFVPFGASYFPEKYFKGWHPYVWHVLQECERISHDVAEYIGKRLLNKPAKWALDPTYKNKKRVLGTYVPDNDGYQRCVNISEADLKKKYGGNIDHRYDYLLDVARFPDQARQAVLQFKAAGVTTLINACDTLSSRFLTESADDINWGPEWLIIGVASQDTDGAARTFRQPIVDGHLFGMSQLGATSLIEGTKGESYKTWKTAFPNQAVPRGFGQVYYRTLALFMMLQAAGPNLTPESIAKGLAAMPEGGGAKGPQGRWLFKGDHTAVEDSREIYYKGSATGYDGGEGAYVESMGGKRFKAGEWPKGEPPIYK